MTNKLKARIFLSASIASFAVAALIAGSPVMAVVILGVAFVFIGTLCADAITEETP